MPDERALMPDVMGNGARVGARTQGLQLRWLPLGPERVPLPGTHDVGRTRVGEDACRGMVSSSPPLPVRAGSSAADPLGRQIGNSQSELPNFHRIAV